jgi:hypothetical protein
LLKRFFKDKGLRKWFVLPENVEIFCEKEIMDSNGLRSVADRVLVSPEKVTVIEFKCGEPRSRKHRGQVLTYLRLLAEVFSNRNIEGWLVYVNELTREKIDRDGDYPD